MCLLWVCGIAFVALCAVGCNGASPPSGGYAKPTHKRSGPHRPADPFGAGMPQNASSTGLPVEPPVGVMFINGESISADDVLNPVREELEEKARSMSPDRYRRYAAELLANRIRDEARSVLLYQEACKTVGEEESKKIDSFVDARIRDIINEEYAGRQTRYEKALARKGMTLQDDRERVRRDLIVQRHLYQNVTQRIAEPTRRELWQYFQEQKESLSKPQRREMCLIEVTRTEPVDRVAGRDGTTAPADARDAIAAAQAELNAGGDFADVARTYSTGLHARNGGEWGGVTRDGVRERWQAAVNALFVLESGQTSDVIETPEAFFIVRCGAIDPGQEPDFQALQQELIARYRAREFNAGVDDLVLELQDRSVIEPKDLSRFLRGVIEAAPKPGHP